MILKTSAFVFLALALSACEVVNNLSSAPIPQPDGVLKAGTVACYLNNCFETLRLSGVNDQNYVYPDPKNFPNEALRPQYHAPFAILDVADLDPNLKLAQNFVLSDFMSPDKGRYALYSADVITKLQLMRNYINKAIVVNSGYRSPGYNRNVDGAAAWSRHTYGDAVDFYIPGNTIASLKSLCEKYGASFTLQYPAHIHCDWRMTKLDPAFYDESLPKPKAEIAAKDVSPYEKLISDQSRIVVTTQDNEIAVSVSTPINEDEEGDPVYAWTVTLPTGEERTYSTPSITIPQMSGTYVIKSLVGGSIAVEDTFQW
jgi:hypothetical protein